MPRLFCFGLGFSALTFARHMQQQGWQVAGTCRSEEQAEVLRAEGFDVHLFGDAPLADPAQALAGTTHLLASVPPGDDGDPVVGTHGKDIQTVSSLEWIGYLSTTGVYGDRKGGFVNETSMLLPSTERGKKRVTAELVWQDLAAAMNVPLHMFRLAGIYGPGRRFILSRWRCCVGFPIARCRPKIHARKGRFMMIFAMTPARCITPGRAVSPIPCGSSAAHISGGPL